MAQATLSYGHDSLTVDVPDTARVTTVRKSSAPKLADPHRAVVSALDEDPIEAPPLAELAAGGTSACIVVCDITRPVPNGLFLRPVVDRLVSAGMALDAITILVATGLHRAGDRDELAELIGDPWVVDHVRIVWHDARDPQQLVDLGRTEGRGTPIVLNRLLVEADLRIVTGLVEPHFMAGWSGGRKVVAPGVAGHETIRTFHSARFMEDPHAIQCNLRHNPLHEEQLEIVARLGEVYAINTVIDEDRDLIDVNFGEVVSSHLASVSIVEDLARVELPRRFSTVVTSAAGHPLDKTYYQTIKAMVTPLGILAEGGTLIIASACSEGLGSAEFRAAQRRLVASGVDGFLDSIIDKPLADIDEWQTEMQLKAMRAGTVQLHTTGLSEQERADTGVELVDSVADAIAAAIDRHGDPQVAIIPEGPYVVPIHSERSAATIR